MLDGLTYSLNRAVAVLDGFFRRAAQLGLPDQVALVGPRLVALAGDPRPAVAAGAVRTLAAWGDRMNENVRLLAGAPLGARWEPDEVGAAVSDLLAKAVPPQKVYGT